MEPNDVMADNFKTTEQPMVQMIAQLKPTKPSGELLTPDESADLADQVLNRVASEVGRTAKRVKVFRNMYSFIVEADRDFQASLARQPEVTSMIPNIAKESFALPPIRKRKI